MWASIKKGLSKASQIITKPFKKNNTTLINQQDSVVAATSSIANSELKHAKKSFFRSLISALCTPIGIIGGLFFAGTLAIPVVGWAVGLGLLVTSAVVSISVSVANVRAHKKIAAERQIQDHETKMTYGLEAVNVASSTSTFLEVAKVFLPAPMALVLSLMSFGAAAASWHSVAEDAAKIRKEKAYQSKLLSDSYNQHGFLANKPIKSSKLANETTLQQDNEKIDLPRNGA